MSDVQLSDALLVKLAGWDAVKQARALVAAERVQTSDWQPPKLQGSVQEGSATYRAGLVIRSATDADNLCTCRLSRQRGLICAHSIAIGFHYLKKQSPVISPPVIPARTQPAEIIKGTEPLEFKLHLAGGLAVLQARLECFCGGKSVHFIPPDALARLARGGFMGPDRQGLYHLKGQDAVLNFFARHYPGLQKEWAVTLEERLERSTQNLERVEPRFQITPSGEQWFDLHVTYDTASGERLAPAEVRRLLRSGRGHTQLPNGKFALLDTGAVEELEQVLADAAPQQHDGAYRLSNAQAGFLDATLRQQTNWRVRAPARWTGRAA